MTEKMQKIQFPLATDEQWRKTAEMSLRNTRTYEELKTETIEGLTLEPLYSKESAGKYFQGAAEVFTKKIRSGMTVPGWIIAQEVFAPNSEQFMGRATHALENGNEAIVYDGNEPLQWQEKDLESLTDLITMYPIYFYDVQVDDPIVSVLQRLKKEKRKKVQGIVTGYSLPEGYEHVRSTLGSAVEEHHQGADAVTELAIVLAKAAEASERFDNFQMFANDFAVRFAVDTDFFMEIAKLRAFRVLWQTFTRSYHAQVTKIPIVAETSRRSYTKYDPATNMLRAGNETLAAVLGGVDVFTVHPHLILEAITSASIRTARNMQLVIREETMLKELQDPAGGSYFIDTLTSQLTKEAWHLFLKIEAAGGYTAYQASGMLQERLDKKLQTRKQQLAIGEKTLVGTNRYADPKDERSGLQSVKRKQQGRLASKLEGLRDELHVHGPKTVLLRFGTLASSKSATDVAKGLLAVGGIAPEESPVFSDVEEAMIWLSSHHYDYYLLCVSQKQFNLVAGEISLGRNYWLDAVGQFTESEKEYWLNQGFTGFIEQKQDVVQKLMNIKHEWQRRRQR